MPRRTPRTHLSTTELRDVRLGALRSWTTGDTLEDVANRFRVRPGWLYAAIRADIATVQRHFGRGVTALDIVRDSSLELGIGRDRIPIDAAIAFAGYCIRRLYAREKTARIVKRTKSQRRHEKEVARLEPGRTSLAATYGERQELDYEPVTPIFKAARKRKRGTVREPEQRGRRRAVSEVEVGRATGEEAEPVAG